MSACHVFGMAHPADCDLLRSGFLEVLEAHLDPGGGRRSHVGGDEPGCDGLAVMPNGPSSMASVLVKPCMPDLAAE